MNTQNEAAQLTLVQQTLSLPGCQLNLRGLEIRSGVNADGIKKVGSSLLAVTDVLKWAWADFMTGMSDRACGGADDSEVLARYCDEHAIPAKAKREMLLVARYYSAAERCYPLPYEYYREALMAPRGAKKKSLAYLARAAEEQLSLGEFRRMMRKAEAAIYKPSAQSVFKDYSVVYDFAKFAKSQLAEDIEKYSEERAKAVLADLADAIEYIRKLREIAGEAIAIETEEVED